MKKQHLQNAFLVTTDSHFTKIYLESRPVK